jgi:hypothetical protein
VVYPVLKFREEKYTFAKVEGGKVVYPVLKFREEKYTFAKVEGGKVDFFQLETPFQD